MSLKKLAVVFPGIGYTKDKPLLYYASKICVGKGYDVLFTEYRDLPAKIVGDTGMMFSAVQMAYVQTVEQLKGIGFTDCADVVFIGKSIGTIIAAKYAVDNGIRARQIWYTPLEATFMFSSADAVAFIGDDDPWSDVDKVKETAKDKTVKLYSYQGCNHSLESSSVGRNISILQDVMKITDEYLG